MRSTFFEIIYQTPSTIHNINTQVHTHCFTGILCLFISIRWWMFSVWYFFVRFNCVLCIFFGGYFVFVFGNSYKKVSHIVNSCGVHNKIYTLCVVCTIIYVVCTCANQIRTEQMSIYLCIKRLGAGLLLVVLSRFGSDMGDQSISGFHFSVFAPGTIHYCSHLSAPLFVFLIIINKMYKTWQWRYIFMEFSLDIVFFCLYIYKYYKIGLWFRSI